MLSGKYVGYLPEHFRFHEWLTAAEFLDLHGNLYGMSKEQRDEAGPRLLALVGLYKFGEHFATGMLRPKLRDEHSSGWKIELPARPMLGCIGVAPAYEIKTPRSSTSLAGAEWGV